MDHLLSLADECWNAVLASGSIADATYEVVFPDRTSFIESFSSIDFVVPPGAEAILSGQNATLEAVLSLSPIDGKKRWGVYVVVFQRGHETALYVGSGTSAKPGGLSTRIRQYHTRGSTPTLVEEATRKGFHFVHAVPLLYAPRPGKYDRIRQRAVWRCLEGVLTFKLGVFRNPSKTYGMPPLERWVDIPAPWRGLCSHNPINEPIAYGDDDATLTRNEVKALEDARKVKDLQYHRDFMRKYMETHPDYVAASRASGRAYHRQARATAKASKSFFCQPCDFIAGSEPLLKRHLKSAAHCRTLGVPPPPAPFHCNICNVPCQSKSDRARHNLTKNHKARVEATNKEKSIWHCGVCNTPCLCKATYLKHIAGAKHQKRVWEMEAQLARETDNPPPTPSYSSLSSQSATAADPVPVPETPTRIPLTNKDNRKPVNRAESKKLWTNLFKVTKNRNAGR